MLYQKGEYQREAAVFKALGHPARLWMAQQLAHGREHCVRDFVEALRVEYATVSKHLAILKQAGILVDEKRGKQVFYRLACTCVTDFIGCLQNRPARP
ncbi:MAG: metalloregulator ArsR/SmtB family transcription factor [Lentisphaeria bacterium]|nr:metalloregulator ArsR/SmtB family transcription factor [Lentisphaeria bacterium]